MKKIKSGIYKIENIINKKCYIGRSIDIYGRWYRHKNNLTKNKHINYILQNSWNKYGEANFKFSILEECIPDEDFQINREKYWRDIENDNFNIGLCERGGKFELKGHPREKEIRKKLSINAKGRKHSEETKRKMSLSRKGKKKSSEWKRKIKNSQPIELHQKNSKKYWTDENRKIHGEKAKGINKCQIMRRVSVDGVEYESISDAARSLGIPRDRIKDRFKSKTKRFENYKFI
jgi:group I intron endonuclease